MPGGYMGQILRVDVTNKTHKVEPLDPAMARDYIGGRGFVQKILFDEVPVGADPLGPENKVVVAPGPLSGVFMPASGKVQFGALSPATGIMGDANMGGHFSSEVKYAGYDAIIIEGMSAEPCVVVIDDDKVQVIDGSKYWGKGCSAAEHAIKQDLGEDFQVAVIGPAGENLVNIACIGHDYGRQAGRCGIGAVLGSKKVKAIAVRGTKSIPLHDPETVRKKAHEMFEGCFSKPGFKEWTPQGTPGVTPWVNEVGAFPTKNFWTTYFDHHPGIGGEALLERIWLTDKGCFCCPTPCGKYSLTKVNSKSAYVEGPEYETVALIGGNCMLRTIEEVAYGNYLCDELGLDTISGGNVVAFALECFERGIITEEQVGRKVEWGDIDSFEHLVRAIAYREGIGDVLADGVKAAAEAFGGGSEKFAIHVKGLEWSGYEARWAPAMMLAYMTCDIGAHHNRAWAITYDVAKGREEVEGKAAKVIELQRIRPAFDLLGNCRLQWVEIGFEFEHYPEMFKAVTGRDLTIDELFAATDRVWNLTRTRAFLEKPGFGRQEDYPPARFYEEEIPNGPAQGKVITRDKLDKMLDEYYALRGWDSDGKPTVETLRGLGLDDCVTKLQAAGLL
ncbi:MAG: aldehyde ferredoxin oxidoreductase family protein [Bacillota bacterium]|jgi:aldehyde:ferredoxin oxidoreductase|nr:aldehyde ferredoxin oxidoreductase family protein [Bacillota bacterium]